FFFFSSRRRHTRFSRDWSSDVCSSDLAELQVAEGRKRGQVAPGRSLFSSYQRCCSYSWYLSLRLRYGAGPLSRYSRQPQGRDLRSEERRVGKECRSRGSPKQ